MSQDVALLTQWRERLERQEESGLTIEAFCEREGVSTSMFYRWRRHLQDPRRNSCDRTGGRAKQVKNAAATAEKAGEESRTTAKRRTGNLRSFCNCPCEACGRCLGSS